MSYPAVGIPVAAPEIAVGRRFTTDTNPEPPPVARSRSLNFLASNGMPDGINDLFIKACDQFPLRIWVIDNSGSMQTADGKRLVHGPDGKESVVSTSRWAELGDSLMWHAQNAAHLAAPTELRLLNPPGNRSHQVLTIGQGSDGLGIEGETRAVRQMVNSAPTGRTPLCEQIRQVCHRVESMAGTLRASGQRVVIVIASDGAATDGDVAAAMRPLQQLPVWVVVRLCTDDESVVNYWNRVDEDLEIDMDVLDDLGGEAGEVTAHNAWLTYGAALHRLREWGCTERVMDLLDEKPLGVTEMRELVELILGRSAMDVPDPQLSYPQFEAALKQVMASQRDIWCPMRNKKKPWFSERKLRKAYKKGSVAGCSVM